MREELRQCNSIGTVDGIEFFLERLLDDRVSSVNAMKSLCSFYSLQQLNCSAAFLFFEAINLISLNNGKAVLTDHGNRIALATSTKRMYLLAQVTLAYLNENSMLDFLLVKYDISKDAFTLPLHSIPLSCAVFRNFLLTIGVLFRKGNALCVAKEYENLFSQQAQAQQKKTSQEELMQRLQQQQDDGETGELFVLEFENKRTAAFQKVAKRISTVDVSAGYDVISFEGSQSTTFDRFIEVKSFRGKPHFYWSENEHSVAALLADNYYIYLVDLNAVNNPQYAPTIIQNPARNLADLGWIIKPQSYFVQQV